MLSRTFRMSIHVRLEISFVAAVLGREYRLATILILRNQADRETRLTRLIKIHGQS